MKKDNYVLRGYNCWMKKYKKSYFLLGWSGCVVLYKAKCYHIYENGHKLKL